MKMEKKKSSSSIPIIDLQGFELGQQEFNKLREACEEWGCFKIINHKIPLTLASEMKSVVRSLLDLPGDIKRRCDDVAAGTGYVGPCKANPLYETLGLYDLGSSHVHNLCSRLDASSHQREVIEMYTKATQELLMDLAQKLAESLGLAGYDKFREWSWQLWNNKYSFTPQSVGSSGVGAHTDYGFLTILQIDEDVRGLEVMDVSDNYVPVDDPSPGTFLVNIGDIATAWSNGRFRNVKHRVVCKEASVRVSIATILLAPKAKVEAPPELVDAEHPRLYVPFIHAEYAKLRQSNPIRTGVALDLLRIKT